MFKAKILLPVARILGILLILKVLLVVTMFVWGHFGAAPVVVFDPRSSMFQRYVLLMTELSTSAFLYFFIGALANMVDHKNHMKDKIKAMAKAVAPKKTAAKKTTRKRATKKKK